MIGIQIQDLSKEFFSLRGKTIALRDINLEIEQGTLFVLLGPSGCGKTTLLNIVAGLEKPTTGEIWIAERLAASSRKRTFLTPRERNVAMVFQSYALYPHLNVFENIAFPLKIAKRDKTEICRSVERVADMLEISHLLRSKPSELSGGQKQRVAIGRAIVRRPYLLLLDEPLSNLDAQLRVNMRGELKQLQRQLGVTTLYVTHDQTEAMTLGDRIAVIKDGELQQVGKPDDIYNNPENIFVARFVGTPPMNLLNSEILKVAERKLKISDRIAESEAILGVRPEHIRINDAEGIFHARISLIESLGVEALLHLQIEKYELLARVSGNSSFKEGDPVRVGFDKKNIHIFDKDGKRIEL